MTKTLKAASAATIANIGAAHERAQTQAQLIGAVRLAQERLKEQRAIQRELIARRVKNLDDALAAAAAAGIDLAALVERDEC